jgi:hypothetical protein
MTIPLTSSAPNGAGKYIITHEKLGNLHIPTTKKARKNGGCK